MEERLKISIADDERSMTKFLTEAIKNLNHDVASTASDGEQLIKDVNLHKPDLIITDIKMPKIDGLEAAERLYEKFNIPSIVISAHHEKELIDRSLVSHGVFAYLIKPASIQLLGAQIGICMSRHREFEDIKQEAIEAKTALEHRKIIERAKGIIMRQLGLSEPEAFRRLQKFSNNSNRKLSDVAKSIIEAHEANSAIQEPA